VRHIPPGLARRDDEPDVPFQYEVHDLPASVRAELRGIPTDLAKIVGAHLAAVGEYLVDDPQLALRHAHAARRRAARLTVTREALGEAAYAAGEWTMALQEFRALRRMTGNQEWLPVMADCERALGRPEAALRLARESQDLSLTAKDRAEMRIVEAGARADLGQHAEALRLLRSTLAMTPDRAVGSKVRVGYALADLLLDQGHQDEAMALFAKVAAWDTDGETDAAERVDAFDGMVLEVGDWDDEDEQQDDEPDPAPATDQEPADGHGTDEKA